MSKRLFALLIAGSLMIPHITLALGNDSTVGFGTARSAAQPSSWEALPLQPVPHLNEMPWLNSGAAFRGPKIDLLLNPKLETVGPFLLQPEIPTNQFSPNTRSQRLRITTE